MPDLTTCAATRNDGQPCATAFALCPECGRCTAHCEHRRDAAQAARAKGGLHRAERVRSAKYRVVDVEGVPEGRRPESIDDTVAWSSWLALAVVTGTIDPATCREANRSLATLKDALNKRDLLRRIRDLEKTLTDFEKERHR